TLRRSRITVDHHYLTGLGHINQHRDFTTQGMHVRIDHALGKDGGDRRIDGITSLAQDLSAYESRQVMLSGNHAVRSHDGRTKSHTHTPLHVGLRIADRPLLSAILYWGQREMHAESAAHGYGVGLITPA